ncbi:hypothetical protein ACA910_002215 [Epithemia clementina (nom. ined.)]
MASSRNDNSSNPQDHNNDVGLPPLSSLTRYSYLLGSGSGGDTNQAAVGRDDGATTAAAGVESISTSTTRRVTGPDDVRVRTRMNYNTLDALQIMDSTSSAAAADPTTTSGWFQHGGQQVLLGQQQQQQTDHELLLLRMLDQQQLPLPPAAPAGYHTMDQSLTTEPAGLSSSFWWESQLLSGTTHAANIQILPPLTAQHQYRPTSSSSANAAVGTTGGNLLLQQLSPQTSPFVVPLAAAATAAATAAASWRQGDLRLPATTTTSTTNNSLNLSDLPDLRQRVRGYVNEVILSSALPFEEKRPYLEALAAAPRVVEMESDPLQFVRFCEYNVLAGARRLCLYWKERRNVFGLERAFLPLVLLTDSGALTQQDIFALHAGYPTLLPVSDGTDSAFDAGGSSSLLVGDDSKARPQPSKQKHPHEPPPAGALFLDRRKYLPYSTPESRLRCLFYACQILAKDDRAQTEGVLLLILLVTQRAIPLDLPYARSVLSLLYNAMPIKFNVHVFNMPHPKKIHMVQEMLTSGNLLQMLQLFNSVGVHTVDGDEPEQKMKRILEEELGLDKKDIPVALGGDFRAEDFLSRCRQQEVLELQLYREILPHQQSAAGLEEDKAAAPDSAFSTFGAAAAAAGKASPVSGLQGYAALASKPAAAKKKAPPSYAMMMQPSDVTSGEQQLQQAGGDDHMQDHEEREEAKRKMLDLMHSRRKREKKRQELQSLKEESSELARKNQRLKADHAMLEQLLAEAQSLLVAIPGAGAAHMSEKAKPAQS